MYVEDEPDKMTLMFEATIKRNIKSSAYEILSKRADLKKYLAGSLKSDYSGCKFSGIDSNSKEQCAILYVALQLVIKLFLGQ